MNNIEVIGGTNSQQEKCNGNGPIGGAGASSNPFSPILQESCESTRYEEIAAASGGPYHYVDTISSGGGFSRLFQLPEYQRKVVETYFDMNTAGANGKGQGSLDVTSTGTDLGRSGCDTSTPQ